MLTALPPFCVTFFRGIEQTTSSRTRIAYAYDLKVFFEFLLKENPALKGKEMRDITLADLDTIKTHRCAKQAARYLMTHAGEKLPKRVLVAFE